MLSRRASDWFRRHLFFSRYHDSRPVHSANLRRTRDVCLPGRKNSKWPLELPWRRKEGNARKAH
jgi:hypothetical protein